MQYGFAIDHRTCIGCHACTVACKTEHEVPLGQFRTWVKYVDSGSYPDNTRDFGVMRCNHCTDAPCVAICPTEALFKRDDGIVDFDSSACIGCKACLQACPYDALYIDEDTHTAAKCNFCAHRIDDGLEPACVVVCPTESIWVGDLHDSQSGISQLVRSHETQVRAPEQGTGPNVFYLGASPSVIDPLAAPVDDTYIWAQPDSLRLAVAQDLPVDPATNARTTLNTAHPVVWGWKVTGYLWTKAVAAGALMTAAVGVLGGGAGALAEAAAPLTAMIGLLATAVLLIADLKRPERFYYLLTRAHMTSWLVKGGFVLAGAAGVSFAWLVVGLLGPPWLLGVLAVLGAVAGVLTAGYTAFLFGQAEGRDLWQSPWLFWHLVVQGVMVGSGVMLLLAVVVDTTAGFVTTLQVALALGALGHLGIALIEHGWGDERDHGTANARAARAMMTRGRHARTYRTALGLGLAVLLGAALAALTGVAALGLVAAVSAQVSLVLYEAVFVRSAQEVPLS